MSFNLALAIREVSECSYHPNMRDYFVNILNEIVSYAKVPYNMFKVRLGGDVLCSIKLVLKQHYNNNYYDIPVIIQLSKNMPKEAPLFFIELAPGTVINTGNPNINPINNRIETPCLRAWAPHSRICPIIDEIKISFTAAFPICKAPSNANVMSSYQAQPSNSLQQPFGGANDTSKSMMANQGGLNRPGYLANRNVASGFGNNVSFQAQMTPQQGQEAARQILLSEAYARAEGKYKEEMKKTMQQRSKLENYKNQFSNETEKMSQYLANTPRVTQASQEKLQEINSEIQTTLSYLTNNSNKQLTPDNCMDFIKVEGERNNMIISLIAREAMIEEMLAITKKAFEKQAVDCVDAIKFIRSDTRHLFAVKFQREKLIDSSPLQY